MVEEALVDKYTGAKGAAALTDVRRHTRETDTRYTQRVAYFMEFHDVNEAADRVEALASGALDQSDSGEKTPEELYKSAVDLGNVLKDIANVLRAFPGYKAAIEKGNEKILGMEEKLGGLERLQSSVLAGLEGYMELGREEIENQTKIIKDEVGYLKDQMGYVRGEVRGNRTETFEYLGQIFKRMEGLTAETGRFMEVVTNLSRGMPNAIARRLDELQQKVDQSLSSSNLTDVVEMSMIRLSQKKISLVDAGWQAITSLTDVDSLRKLKQTAESIEKNMASLDKIYVKLEQVRTEVKASGVNFNESVKIMTSEIDELGNNIVSDGKITRHAALRAVARADIHTKKRFSEAYKKLDLLKEKIDGLEGRIKSAMEEAVDAAMNRYRVMGLTEEACQQIGGVMVGAFMTVSDEVADKIYRFGLRAHEEAFKNFSDVLGRDGVRIKTEDKKEILDAVNKDRERSMTVIESVDKRLGELERRLTVEDLVTEKKARAIAAEEAAKATEGMDIKSLQVYIDTAAEKAAAQTAEKIKAEKPADESAGEAKSKSVTAVTAIKRRSPRKSTDADKQSKRGQDKEEFDADKTLDRILGE